jgi:Ca-activated chloride channel family protein
MNRLCPLAILLLISSPSGRSIPQAASQTTFRSGIDVVRLDVLVTAGGRPIVGLGPQDFEVLDNDVPQRVNTATVGGRVEVVLVLDTSGSVTGEPLEQLVAACQLAVAELRPDDRASLVTFSSQISLEANAVQDPAALRIILGGARPAGRTVLWDALFAGLSLVARSSERSLVLLFTDGVDNGSWMGRDQLAEVMKRTESVVYAVQSRFVAGIRGPVPFSNSPDLMAGAVREREKASIDVTRVMRQSGGEVFEADSAANLGVQFAAVLRQFRSRYLLSYEPTGVRRGDGWHRVEVRVKGRKAKVVTRTGYFAAARDK